MASIFDRLQKRVNATEKAAVSSVGSESYTEQAANVQQAKTGKVGASQRISSLAEEAERLKSRGMVQNEAANLRDIATEVGNKEAQTAAALAQEKSTLEQNKAGKLEDIRLDTQLQREDSDAKKDRFLSQLMSDEELTTQRIQNTMQQSVQKLLSDKKINEDQIFSQFRQDTKELQFRRDAAELEQLGMTLALRDKTYMDEIKGIGMERDLQDDINFAKEAQRLTFGDELNTYLEKLGYLESDAADERAFVEKIAAMDINQAIQIADYAARSESMKQLISGATDLAGAGVDAYYAEKPKK